MASYDSRVPADSVWCISKHLGGKYHAYEVLEKLAELSVREHDVPVLSRDLSFLGSRAGESWDVVWLRLTAALEVLDQHLESYLDTREHLMELLADVRDLRRAVLVFRLDYNVWKSKRQESKKPAFESAILQEAMYVRDHLLNIEEHIIEVLEKHLFDVV